MYLKSLELHGFKSFPDKTPIAFKDGVTVIVGPNGSGKSNVADAMRWVLGEISGKSLRSSKMEDVIFAGAEGRRPMGYAEVSVTFDNSIVVAGDDIGNNTENSGQFETPKNAAGRIFDTPYDEVVVTRRYFRTGESEYYINRRAVRLRDIHELLMNTGVGREGYSIIGQGRIAEILSKRGEDRRGIFEDAAGIAKYRYKKQESERKLAETEDNMTRVTDILEELAARLGPLEREAGKAKKYIELSEEKKRADISLWLLDDERLRGESASVSDRFKLSSQELSAAEDTLRAYEVRQDKLWEESQSKRQGLERLQSSIAAMRKQAAELDGEYKLCENNISHIEKSIDELTKSRADLTVQIGSQKRLIGEKQESIDALIEKLSAREAEYREMRASYESLGAKLAGLDAELESGLRRQNALESEAADISVRISVMRGSRENDRGRLAEIERGADGYRREAEKLGEMCAEIEREIAKYNSEITQITDGIAGLATELREIRTRIAGFKAEGDAHAAQANAAVQKMETLKRMEEHFEGYNYSVRFIMKQTGENGGFGGGVIYGPLSRLIGAGREHLTAVETALGAAMQNIVVDNEETAKAAIAALKSARAGRATFYPLTSIQPPLRQSELAAIHGARGFIGTADTLVSCDDKFKPVVSALLARTAVFDNIDNAAAAAKSQRYRIRAVTLDGQQINAGGSFTGGSVKTDSGILSRASEIEQARATARAAAAERDKSLAQAVSLERQTVKIEGEISALEERHDILEALRNSEKIKFSAKRANYESNMKLAGGITADCEKLRQAELEYDKNIATLENRASELSLRRDESVDHRRKISAERERISDERGQASESLTAAVIEINGIKKDAENEGRLLESLESRLGELEIMKQNCGSVLSERTAELADLQNRKKNNRADLETRNADLKKLLAESALFESEGLVYERKQTELRQLIKEAGNRRELIFKENARLESRSAHLRAELDKHTARLWDEYELTRGGALSIGYPQLREDERTRAAAQLTSCKNKLRDMGSVNLGAIEEFAMISERHGELKRQSDDLEGGRNELRSIINRLEEEMRHAFNQSFNLINENFGRVFRELFGGGSAELSLNEPDDVLSSGIEIRAAPPGKIVKNLMQLSGGEQAFVAIALFFAIIAANPTPFCILDEIEASLDDANVVRFADYIKKYSKKNQFIIISHRRGTMEIADKLYGVTMPQRGISKVIGLNVGDVNQDYN